MLTETAERAIEGPGRHNAIVDPSDIHAGIEVAVHVDVVTVGPRPVPEDVDGDIAESDGRHHAAGGRRGLRRDVEGEIEARVVGAAVQPVRRGVAVRPQLRRHTDDPGARGSRVPIAIAMATGVLLHCAVLPIPKNDAQVASAGGADPNPAAASAPAAIAPTTTPVSLPTKSAFSNGNSPAERNRRRQSEVPFPVT